MITRRHRLRHRHRHRCSVRLVAPLCPIALAEACVLCGMTSFDGCSHDGSSSSSNSVRRRGAVQFAKRRHSVLCGQRQGDGKACGPRRRQSRSAAGNAGARYLYDKCLRVPGLLVIPCCSLPALRQTVVYRGCSRRLSKVLRSSGILPRLTGSLDAGSIRVSCSHFPLRVVQQHAAAAPVRIADSERRDPKSISVVRPARSGGWRRRSHARGNGRI